MEVQEKKLIGKRASTLHDPRPAKGVKVLCYKVKTVFFKSTR